MSEIRRLDLLDPKFLPLVDTLRDELKSKGFDARVSTSLRTPFQQARLWRQSRAREEIDAKISELLAAGAGYLADVLETVGPQSGKPVTKAPPGFSWHQWGEAVDFFVVVDGAAVWNPSHPFYLELARTAEVLGLLPGRVFKTSDPPHVQLRHIEPDDAYSAAKIASIMENRFGRDEAAWLKTMGL